LRRAAPAEAEVGNRERVVGAGLAANPDGRGAILEATIIADRLSAPLPVR
jgi:hypothetical protein